MTAVCPCPIAVGLLASVAAFVMLVGMDGSFQEKLMPEIKIPNELWMLVYADEPSVFAEGNDSSGEHFGYLAFFTAKEAMAAAVRLFDVEDTEVIAVRVK